MVVTRLERIEAQYGEPIPIRRHPGDPSVDVFAAAHAVGIVALVAYLLCTAIAYTSIEILVGLGQLWFHGVAFQITPPVFALFPFVVGAATMTGVAWMAAASAAALYNILRHR
jgi:hypothetical protein